ncbi:MULTISPECIES: 5-formyltetrahydrofolate cyclo-ligase [Proteus]|uniref:5-formyltetrahydrofolate cyclo-ligase n=1 Tax=Proteus mirabilis (strain HI4320) TaxID=529507 RepID=B4F0P5_PROMH|nr:MULTISPECIES: 5-formyltetrahydrofolate cyclo-ligase [Proteus]MBA7796350.1 5-formyltetrahydrofolate cyclo-ligase [Citrobacter sp. RHBSTW-01065]SSJ60788.1 5-formyltetrahydrofolate cyclo-ligase [Klebsiella pneumoniae]ALE22885.1 5-formyltetrahydrofolate cyclo-ligase [Proteus mirabilis]ALE26040.1 5-formyltetrahydrofolate cyclo-ligase [Proteus mirabilis]AND12194.1 5-formyltetrahydrofolate cyclo-ligase [Proteus mirabilis]
MTQPPVFQQRDQIRKAIRQKRRQLTVAQQQDAAHKLSERVLHHPKVKQAKTIALFLSFDGEIDTAPLITHLWDLNKQVCLPVLHPFHRHHLLFLRYAPTTQLVKNRFNIFEPPLNVNNIIPISDIDIIFTPLVAFDESGQRLGMGGGFYDRTLENWQRQSFYPMGLAHTCQQVHSLPSADWDIPLPEIITPDKVWRFDERLIQRN